MPTGSDTSRCLNGANVYGLQEARSNIDGSSENQELVQRRPCCDCFSRCFTDGMLPNAPARDVTECSSLAVADDNLMMALESCLRHNLRHKEMFLKRYLSVNHKYIYKPLILSISNFTVSVC